MQPHMISIKKLQKSNVCFSALMKFEIKWRINTLEYFFWKFNHQFFNIFLWRQNRPAYLIVSVAIPHLLASPVWRCCPPSLDISKCVMAFHLWTGTGSGDSTLRPLSLIRGPTLNLWVGGLLALRTTPIDKNKIWLK